MQRVDGLALKKIPIGGEQHPGLDLSETVQHALDAKIRRTRRPGGSDAGGGQHGNDGLGHVGHKSHHPIPGLNAHVPQGSGQSCDLIVKLGVGHFNRILAFTFKNQGQPVVAKTQQVFGKIQPGSGKPVGARHFRYVVNHLIIRF